MTIRFPPSTCAEFEAWQLARPTPPGWIQPLAAALFAVFVLLAMTSIASFYALRHEPRLAVGRSLALHVSTVVNNAIVSMSAVLIRYATYNPNTNASTMPCWYVAVAGYVSISGLAGSITLRLWLLFTQMTRANLIAQVKFVNAEQDSTAARLKTTTTTTSSIIQNVFHLLFTGKSSSSQLPKTRAVSTATSSLSPDAGQDYHDINELNILGSKRAIMTLTLLFLLPGVFISVVVLSVVPLYGSSCAGCDYNPIQVLGLAAVAGPGIVFVVLLVYRMRAFPSDAYGVKREYQLLALSTPGLVVPLLLCLFDPNDLGYTYGVMWDMLICFPVTVLLLINFYPVYQAWQDKQAREKYVRQERSESSRVSRLDLGLEIEALVNDARFEEICMRQFVVENLRFLEEALIYRNLYSERAESWRQTRSKRICSVYISFGSPMEINIGHRLRVQVEEAVNKGNAPRDVFNEAVQEMHELLLSAFIEYKKLST